MAELVADGTFLARRHHELLAGEDVDDPTLAALQRLYRQAGDDRQRRRVALQFEKLVREAADARAVVDEPDVESGSAVESNFDERASESPIEMMARVWTTPPWRERGVDPSEGHAHSNVRQGQPLSSWPASPVTEYSRPPIPPPSDDTG